MDTAWAAQWLPVVGVFLVVGALAAIIWGVWPAKEGKEVRGFEVKPITGADARADTKEDDG